jgi:hypothetical protein
MNQQETEQALKELKERLTNEIGKLAGTCHDLFAQIATLRKRVRRIEVDFYKDMEAGEARFAAGAGAAGAANPGAANPGAREGDRGRRPGDRGAPGRRQRRGA